MMIEKTVEKGKSANTDPTPRLFTVLPYPQQIVEFQICPTDHQRRLAMTTTPQHSSYIPVQCRISLWYPLELVLD
jgi:hypothetical protein